MNKIALIIIALFSLNTFAASAQSDVDRKALEILLKNSGQFVDETGESVASMLSSALVTDAETHNKVSNTCSYDPNDELFKCSLVILNADDRVEGRTESSLEIQYELERCEDGMPSDKLFMLSVAVLRAG